MLAAEISTTAATLFGIIIGLLMAIFGAVWRIGTKVGAIEATIKDHKDRLRRIEQHEDDHDKWHIQKGIT